MTITVLDTTHPSDNNNNKNGLNLDSSSSSSLDFDCKTVQSQSSASFAFLHQSDDGDHQIDQSGSQSSWTIRRSSHSEEDSSMLMARSSASSMKNNKNLRELTINKLNYDAVGLIGRESEMETLTTCIHRASRSPTITDHDKDIVIKKELIFIKGYSGMGKSKLVSEARNDISDQGGVMVEGKFDQNNSDQPYAGIIAVFGSMFDKILEGLLGGDSELASLRSSLADELRSDIFFLQDLIPSLADVSRSSNSSNDNQPDEKNIHNYEADFEKLKHALRVLTRILTRHFRPLVFVLDDLQWSDTASLKTIEFLLSDTDNSNGLVVIGLYRSNEVNNEHPLSTTILNLNQQSEQFGFNVTEIEVQNLNKKQVNQIVMAMLGMDDESHTMKLAELCLQRTLGNPFFVIEFIRMLEMEGLLSFNLGLLKWTWDLKAIESDTMSTANVVDLLQARMKKLPEELQQLLQYAACLGSVFKVDTLEVLWTKHKSGDMTTTELGISSLLRRLQQGTFLEVDSKDSYRWTHDKIQEAAMSLGMAAGPTFQYDVGCILYRNLSDKEIEESLFEIVNLINKTNLEAEPEFAELNLRAGNKARASSAFESASKYASIGIKLLPSDKWTSYRDVTLALYTLGAEMEAALGRDTVIDTYFDEILPRDDISLTEKLPVFVAKSYKLCNADAQYKATVEFCCDTLAQFGWKVPKGMLLPVHALVALKRLTQRAKKTPQSHFSERPKMMMHPQLQAAMLFWSRIYYAAFFIPDQFMLVFSGCKMVELTLEHGISALSGYAYISLAMITNAVSGDFKTSAYFAETAVVIQEMVQAKYLESQMLCVSGVFVLCWTKPLQSTIHSFQRSYSLGMRSGNIEFALWSKHKCQTILPYVMGRPLNQISIDSRHMVPQMENLGQNEPALATRIAWQLCLNLLGEAEDKFVLQGRALPPLEDDDFPSAVILGFRNFCQSDLYLFHGEYELAAKAALKCGDSYTKLLTGDFITLIETFHRGVALYAMARRTNLRKYHNPAKGIRKIIKKWARSGNPNVTYYEKLIDAEDDGMSRKYKKAEVNYQEAIKLAAKTGHLHHAGLFNERYADLLCAMKNENEAVYRLEEAVRWYNEWGATLKANALSERVHEMKLAGFFGDIQEARAG